MRELVFTCAMAILGGGCVNVVSHISEYDAAPDVKLGDGGADVEAGPPAVCASGAFWTGGNMANGVMSPGRPCNGTGCHTPTSKTVLTLSGTIYNGAHDTDDCNGVDGNGYAVVPIDKDGNEILSSRLFVNAAGNFYTSKALPSSYFVKVIGNGKEFPMKAEVKDGNCNTCHSAEGTMMALGRITAK